MDKYQLIRLFDKCYNKGLNRFDRDYIRQAIQANANIAEFRKGRFIQDKEIKHFTALTNIAVNKFIEDEVMAYYDLSRWQLDDCDEKWNLYRADFKLANGTKVEFKTGSYSALKTMVEFINTNYQEPRRRYTYKDHTLLTFHDADRILWLDLETNQMYLIKNELPMIIKEVDNLSNDLTKYSIVIAQINDLCFDAMAQERFKQNYYKED